MRLKVVILLVLSVAVGFAGCKGINPPEDPTKSGMDIQDTLSPITPKDPNGLYMRVCGNMQMEMRPQKPFGKK